MGENERGHSHGLDTITYGSTVKKSKRVKERSRSIQRKPWERQEEKV